MKTHEAAASQALQARLDRLARTADGLCPADVAPAQWRQETSAPVTAYVVMCRLAPRLFAQSVAAFVQSLEPAWAAAWLRSYTRTVFLLGDPGNLRQRFVFRHESADGSIGWLCPASAGQAMGLQRLLVLFGEHPLEMPDDFEFMVSGAAGTGRALDLRIATGHSTAGGYHVHLNHVLAEGVLSRLIQPGDLVRVRHRPSIQPQPGSDLDLRALQRPAQTGRWHIHAALAPVAAPTHTAYVPCE